MKILNGDLTRSGVSIKPELCHAMVVADKLHLKTTYLEATFTHLLSGRHGAKSLHYAGLACDMRRWHLSNAQDFVTKLSDALGPNYDVILEDTHIHIEFQPEHLPKEET